MQPKKQGCFSTESDQSNHRSETLVRNFLAGTFPSAENTGLLEVKLEDGRTIEVEMPSRMPGRISIGVRMEA